MDYETAQTYDLHITVTDKAPIVNQRLTGTARVTFKVINVEDSDDYNAEVTMSQPRISSPANAAFWAGIPSSSPLEIKLVHKANSQTTDITNDTVRVSFDTSSKSNNLFTVSYKHGIPHVEANKVGATGRGTLIVHIQNVGNVEVNITLVGVRLIELKLLPYPQIQGAPEITELKQISPGHYQQSVIHVTALLSDGFTVDVSESVNTSFNVLNSQEFPGAFKFGPSPKNLFTLEGDGLNGTISLQASFAIHTKGTANVTLSSKVSRVVKILTFNFQGINTTLRGLVGSTKAYPIANLETDDGSQLTVTNFTRNAGLITFSSSDPSLASIDPNSGVVTLLGESHYQVTITATASDDALVKSSVAFFCNLEPNIGHVDIGAIDGPYIPSLKLSDTWNLPVRVNPGASGLLAIHVKINYTKTQLSFASISTSLSYSVLDDSIHIFGAVETPKSTDVAQIVFVVQKEGVPNVGVSFFRTVDTALKTVPGKSTESCSKKILGDINQDCTFDIVDVAYIKCYISSSNTGFTDSQGPKMKSATSYQKGIMDVNLNKRIDNSDASLLSNVYLGNAFFIKELSLSVPHHLKNSSDACNLDFTVKLVDKRGDNVKSPEVEVYFDIAHSTNEVHAQFKKTEFIPKTKKILKDGSIFFGGLIKATYDNSRGLFAISSSESELQVNDLGVSVVQVVSKSEGVKHVIPMFSISSKPTYNGKLDISLESDGRLQAKSGYSPQRLLYVPESKERCKDPTTTVNVEIIFIGDFTILVLGREKEFEKDVNKTLSALYVYAIFKNFTFREGSIVTNFDMTTPKSNMDPTLAKMWNDVKEGIEVSSNGHVVKTKPIMKVDKEDYTKGKAEPTDDGGVPMYIIITAIVAAVLFVILLLVIGYCIWKKNRKINPSRPHTPKGFSNYSSDEWGNAKDANGIVTSSRSLQTPVSERWQSMFLHSGSEEVWHEGEVVDSVSVHSETENVRVRSRSFYLGISVKND